MKAIRRAGVLAGVLVVLAAGAAAGSPAARADNALPNGSGLRAFVDASAPQWNVARADNHDAY